MGFMRARERSPRPARKRGSHTEAQEEYARLIEYIMQNDLAINGHSLEITLIDNGFTNDTSKFVTEISIPIVKK